MARSFSDDVFLVLDAQGGDSTALMDLVREFTPNMKAVARKFDHVLDAEDAEQIAKLAFIEYVLGIDQDKARTLRAAVKGLCLNALNEACGGMSYTSYANVRSAAEAMRTPVNPEDAPALSLEDAAVKHKVSVSLLANYMSLNAPASLDAIVDSAYDEDNPFDSDFGTGFTNDDVDPLRDPEFSNRVGAFDLEEKHESTRASVDMDTAWNLRMAMGRLSRPAFRVMDLVGQGLTDEQIGERLGVERRTVQKTRQRALVSLRTFMSP